ncbi:metallophosphoesterase [Micromonospora aurantiaca]|uniref:Metallophosphoesterase n=1 Tax=Micromonospora aurantiaca (nom. illeg.) TaxID=47850 RepID=A0A6N3K4I8_9ACTN|nr:metallophosphoesterase [Micromonospora aurantiaca]
MAGSGLPQLLAISDLHVVHAENKAIVERLRPERDGDWLVVAGDVGEFVGDIEWALGLLSRRFAKVIWAPGNHELWTPARTRSSCGGTRATSTWCNCAGGSGSSPRRTRTPSGTSRATTRS